MNIDDIGKFGVEPTLINEYIEKIKNGDKIVAVAGEFSSGKSTFINAFLDKKGFIPSAKIECTPVLLDLVQFKSNYIELTYKDGNYEKVENNQENIKKYASNNDGYDKNILSVSIPIDSEYLLNNTHLIDTPGSNTIYKEHGEITSSILKKADIVLYVIKVSLSNIDLQNISEILKYSSQILFIVSHMDEKDGEIYINSSSERINKCVDNIRTELQNKLDIKNPDILPVGSLAYYNDDNMMKEIRNCVKFGIESNSINVLKNRVKNQLKYLLKNRYDEYLGRYELLKTIPNNDIEKLENKYKALNDRLKRVSDQNESEMKMLDVNLEKERNYSKLELEKIFDNEAGQFLQLLINNQEITEEFINYELNKSGQRISEKYKIILDESMNRIIEKVYEEKNIEIDSIAKDLQMNFSINLHSPSLEEIDLSEVDDKLYEMKQEKREIKRVKQIAESEVAITLEQFQSDKEKIEEADLKEDRVVNEKRTIVYNPEYNEVQDEGFGDTGKRVGRFIGEVADIALIFANPAQGTLKVADKVKDTTKVITYVKDKMEKVVNIVDKVKNVSKVKKVGKLGKVINVLDWLSVGKYGEILGENIGNMIKPSKTVFVENMEKRQQWESEINDIDFRLSEIRRNKIELESKISNGEISMIQAKKKVNEYDAKLLQLEETEQELAIKLRREAEMNSKDKINEYYKQEVNKNFQEQKEYSVNSFEKLLMSNYNLIVEKCNLDFSKKIESIGESIENISNKKDNIEEELKTYEEMLMEFENYEQWVEEWIQ